jgi:hypothetical protein
MSTVSSSMRHGAKAEHDAAGGAITASDVIIATGQELTPAMLADRERLMHERRLMAYHNTRLVLALQALGATGEAALEALQRRTLGDDDEDEMQGCRECRAAAIQMRAMDRTVARASLFIESAREQLKAVKSQRAAMTDEVSQLRANLLRCEELLRAKDAEIARLRSEVYHNQPAIEELLALRRTQGDLMQRIRLLQTADPTVRIVQGSSRAAIEAPKAEAETKRKLPQRCLLRPAALHPHCTARSTVWRRMRSAAEWTCSRASSLSTTSAASCAAPKALSRRCGGTCMTPTKLVTQRSRCAAKRGCAPGISRSSCGRCARGSR